MSTHVGVERAHACARAYTHTHACARTRTHIHARAHTNMQQKL